MIMLIFLISKIEKAILSVCAMEVSRSHFCMLNIGPELACKLVEMSQTMLVGPPLKLEFQHKQTFHFRRKNVLSN